MPSNSWPEDDPAAALSSRTEMQSRNHSSGFERVLTDEREVQVFKQFQSSSAIQEILPGCEVQTEYQVEKLSWKVTSAE